MTTTRVLRFLGILELAGCTPQTAVRAAEAMRPLPSGGVGSLAVPLVPRQPSPGEGR